LKEKTALEELTPENIKNYLKDNFTAEYVREVINIESDKIVIDYLRTVTQDLSEGEKSKVF
ncbi:MAG: hypothetical protein HW405_695, partial [Candidatus Berkelbacteria bacterium]|nr:hypothetical protein [Candidatus Berkelbacteria bacterium]